MTPRQKQRRHQGAPSVRPGQAHEQRSDRLRVSLAAVAAGRPAQAGAGLSGLQRLGGNQAVRRLLAVRPPGGTAPAIVQRVSVDEMKQELGSELLHKHVGTEPVPDVSTPDGREEATAAVYYQRAKDDRRSMNTVFFADPAALFSDLRDTNRAQDLKSGPDYTTTRTYPAITVLVVGTAYESPDGQKVKGAVTGPFQKLEIQHGPARPMVKINKDAGQWAFNHLQRTEPKTLTNKVDLLTAEQ